MTPELLSERLLLRPPHKSDLEAIYELGNDPEVMRFITYGKTQSRRAARLDLAKRIKMSQGTTGYWIAEERQGADFIGWFALKMIPDSSKYELGYRLLRKHWGKGYATEGSLKLLEYGFKTLEIDNIMAIAMPENMASRRVMEKVGLQFMGTGTFYNTHCVYYNIDRTQFNSNVR